MTDSTETDIVERDCPKCGSHFFARKTSSGFRTHCSNSCASTGRLVRHGMRRTPEFNVWQHMRGRCNRTSHKAYADYGGRGIKVCDRWNFIHGGFENFVTDMGLRPGDGFTIERVNNDGNYEPSNCKWATRTEQSRNRRCATPKEVDDAIRYGVERGLNFTQIAALTGRSVGATSSRAYRIGLKSGQAPGVNMSARPSPEVVATELGGELA